jgi:hypothetical protein
MSSGQDEWEGDGTNFYGSHKMIHVPCGTVVWVGQYEEEKILLQGGPTCPKCVRGFAAPVKNPA